MEQRLAPRAEPWRVEVRLREATGAAADGCAEAGSLPAATESAGVRAAGLAIVLLLAGIYTWVHIGRGWVPADDGTLSQSALRVLQGQLPHLDFAEIYTGGLSLIHALAFRAFGVNLVSLRICVFLFFLAWIPAVYYIALQFSSAPGAGAITLLAVAWSYPNYPAAMPSWYNLFFATFGAAALLRYLEVRSRRWLFVAGMCGGASILIKIIGAYYVAGALLFLAFLEQSESATNAPARSSDDKLANDSWIYRVFSAGALFLFLATLVNVLRTRLGTNELYEFVLPSASVAGLIVLGEKGVQARAERRFRTIFRALIPFFCGVAAPIIVFLLPYVRSGNVWRVLFGVTSSAAARSVDLSVIRPAGIEKLVYVLPLVALLAAAMYWDKFQSRAIGAALALGAVVLALRATQIFEIVSGVWNSVAALTPIAVLLGAALVWTRRKESTPAAKLQRQQAVLLISLAATCSLVQFPFAAPIYLSYTIPLTLLAVTAIVSTGKTQRGFYALAPVVGFYIVFAVVSLVPRYLYEITHAVGHMDTMQSPRAGGLQIEGAGFFDDLAGFLRAHSPNGLMFAGNDCPELYFLSGLKNVTNNDGGAAPDELLKILRSDDLNLVVINDAPFFRGAVMMPEVRAEVNRRFPNTRRFGIFEVFWKR